MPGRVSRRVSSATPAASTARRRDSSRSNPLTSTQAIHWSGCTVLAIVRAFCSAGGREKSRAALKAPAHADGLVGVLKAARAPAFSPTQQKRPRSFRPDQIALAPGIQDDSWPRRAAIGKPVLALDESNRTDIERRTFLAEEQPNRDVMNDVLDDVLNSGPHTVADHWQPMLSRVVLAREFIQQFANHSRRQHPQRVATNRPA